MAYIAVIDDRATNREVLATLAATVEEQVEVDAFSAPADALDAWKDKVPDLVITDFNMPGMNGAELIRRIRQTEPLSDVPIIVVSAYEDRQYRYDALEAGATDFLRSPIDHFEFRSRVRNLLILRKQQLMLRERAEHLEDRLVDEADRRRQEVRRSRERLAKIVDNVPALIYAVDSERRLILVNRRAADFFGGADAEPDAINRLMARQRESAWAEFEHCGDGGPANPEVQGVEENLVASDGQSRTFLSNKILLTDIDDGRGAVLVVSTDITERVEIERELREAKKKAEIANDAKSQFLMNMSHELRTPLNVIIGFADFIAAQPFGNLGDERYVDHCREIGKSGRHLLSLINEVLELSRLDSLDVPIAEDMLDIRNVFLSAIGEAGEAIENVNVTTKIADCVSELRIRGDEKKLVRMLKNLLKNAAKFSEDGGDVELICDVRDGAFVIQVKDHGIGMTPEEIETAKSRFGQVYDHARTKKYQGAGLGLPVAISIAERHGATFEIDSKKGFYTIVTISFPADRTVQAGGPVAARAAAAGS
ncbi:MAG: hypothetical protein Tsb0010_01850 [Parvularculaceae bacterium]